MAILEPRGASAVTLLHAGALLLAFAWAVAERRARPSRVRGWGLAVALAVAAALSDLLLFASLYASGLSALAATVAFIGGAGLLVVCLLHGWPSRGLVALGLVGVATPFALWAA